ncbi:putative transcription factor-like [Capsicum annuum]|nr:putative transcription factor-like [Capsicum annuum]KAF3671666.1 putative transcription factor-like [Capsicum annuum]
MSIQSSSESRWVTVVNSRFHSITEEYPIYTAAHNIICSVSVSAILLSSEDVSSSSSPYSKACVVSETVVTKSAPKHAIQAFRFLNETSATQSVVASIACDPNVWNEVMQNPSLQEFLYSQKTSASFPDSDHKIDESITDVDSFSHLSDFFNNLFGGNKIFFNTDGSAKLGVVEMTLGASFMGLAVIVMIVIVSKCG